MFRKFSDPRKKNIVRTFYHPNIFKFYLRQFTYIFGLSSTLLVSLLVREVCEENMPELSENSEAVT